MGVKNFKFISTWNTENLSTGSSLTSQIKLPLTSNGVYNFVAYWGDDTSSTITSYNQNEVTHTYISPGTYNIELNGAINGWKFDYNNSDNKKIINISNWGNLLINTDGYQFWGCSNMTCTATDILDMINVTDANVMFGDCSVFNSDLRSWNVSNVNSMINMFNNCLQFDSDLSSWNISKVTNMSDMLNNTALSTTNYDKLLNYWSQLPVQQNVYFGVSPTKYSTASHDILTSSYNWTINDGGMIENTTTTSTTNNSIIIVDNYVNDKTIHLTFNYSTMGRQGSLYPIPYINGNQVSDNGSGINGNIITISLMNSVIFGDVVTLYFPPMTIHNGSIFFETCTIQLNNTTSESTSTTSTTLKPTTTTTTTVIYSTKFISTWNTENLSEGSSLNNQIKLPLTLNGTYNFVVNWGDGISETITSYYQANHTYITPGIYTIELDGIINGWRFYFNNDNLKIINISNWGNLLISNDNFQFYNCKNMTCTAGDTLDVSNVIDMSYMFNDCFVFNGDLSQWNVSNVTNMNAMFLNCKQFNSDLSSWNVSNVIDMSYMFNTCSIFTSNLSNWNVSNVTNMSGMLSNCSVFDSDLRSWIVNNVTDMSSIFSNCKFFTSDLSNWNVSNVTNMDGMFSGTMFNSDLSNWNVSNVTNMKGMFALSMINSDLSNWNVSNVTNMNTMFYYCYYFNRDLSSWDVSNVTDMTDMFNASLISTISSINYDKILNSWSLLSVKPNVYLGANKTQYSSNAVSARNTLISNYGWTINDGGMESDVITTTTTTDNSIKIISNLASGNTVKIIFNRSIIHLGSANYPTLYINGNAQQLNNSSYTTIIGDTITFIIFTPILFGDVITMDIPNSCFDDGIIYMEPEIIQLNNTTSESTSTTSTTGNYTSTTSTTFTLTSTTSTTKIKPLIINSHTNYNNIYVTFNIPVQSYMTFGSITLLINGVLTTIQNEDINNVTLSISIQNPISYGDNIILQIPDNAISDGYNYNNTLAGINYSINNTEAAQTSTTTTTSSNKSIFVKLTEIGFNVSDMLYITTDIGAAFPPSANKSELINGITVSVDRSANQIIITSTGDCLNTYTMNIEKTTTGLLSINLSSTNTPYYYGTLSYSYKMSEPIIVYWGDGYNDTYINDTYYEYDGNDGFAYNLYHSYINPGDYIINMTIPLDNSVYFDFSCSDITNINLPLLTTLKELKVYGKLTEIDINNLPSLIKLTLYNTQISSINSIIGNLTNLSSLRLSDNQISNINVSNLTNLTDLDLSNNQLTTIDVSNLTILTYLYLSNNQLTTIDVSNLTNLNDLDLSDNQISTIDVSNLNNLTYLYLSDNQFTTINVSNLTNLTDLDLSGNQLTTIDVSNLTNLSNLRLSDNQFITINVSNLTDLTDLDLGGNQILTIDISNITNLNDLDLENNQISTIDVSNLTILTYLYLTNNQLTTIDVSNLTNLNDLDLSDNQLTSIDISNTNLQYLYLNDNLLSTNEIDNIIIQLNNNGCNDGESDMTNNSNRSNISDAAFLNLSNNGFEINVEYIDNTPTSTITANISFSKGSISFNSLLVYSNQNFGSVIVDWGDGNSDNYNNDSKKKDGWAYFPDHDYVSFGDYIITMTIPTDDSVYFNFECVGMNSINLPVLSTLKTLIIYNTNITEIDISNLTNLTYFNLNNSQVTNIDISNLINLESLYLNNSQLLTIDVSNLTNLTELDLVGNQISTIDISNNINLTSLYLSNNQLSTIDTSSLTNLEYLYLNDNLLSNIYVSNNIYDLELDNNQLTTIDISNLTKLQNLSLKYNQLSTNEIDNIIIQLDNIGFYNCKVNMLNNSGRSNISDNAVSNLNSRNCNINVEYMTTSTSTTSLIPVSITNSWTNSNLIYISFNIPVEFYMGTIDVYSNGAILGINSKIFENNNTLCINLQSVITYGDNITIQISIGAIRDSNNSFNYFGGNFSINNTELEIQAPYVTYSEIREDGEYTYINFSNEMNNISPYINDIIFTINGIVTTPTYSAMNMTTQLGIGFGYPLQYLDVMTFTINTGRISNYNGVMIEQVYNYVVTNNVTPTSTTSTTQSTYVTSSTIRSDGTAVYINFSNDMNDITPYINDIIFTINGIVSTPTWSAMNVSSQFIVQFSSPFKYGDILTFTINPGRISNINGVLINQIYNYHVVNNVASTPTTTTTSTTSSITTLPTTTTTSTTMAPTTTTLAPTTSTTSSTSTSTTTLPTTTTTTT